MHEEQKPLSPEEIDQLAKLGYEARDANISALARWGIGLGVFLGFSALVSLALYRVIMPTSVETNEPIRPMGLPSSAMPEHTVQANPDRDIREFRASEAAKIDGYGWANKEKGQVRIPVSVAMDKLLEKGLPARTQTPSEEKTGR